MTRIGMFIGVAVVALLPLSAMADDEHVVVQGDSIQWKAGPPTLPKGAQFVLLFGDPAKEGPYGYRVKVPAGYTVPAHMHPTDENITVISGTFNIGTGDNLDPKKGEAVKAGGFFHMPKGMHHYMSFSQETVFQANGNGPAGITYINPSDDPRKTN